MVLIMISGFAPWGELIPNRVFVVAMVADGGVIGSMDVRKMVIGVPITTTLFNGRLAEIIPACAFCS